MQPGTQKVQNSFYENTPNTSHYGVVKQQRGPIAEKRAETKIHLLHHLPHLPRPPPLPLPRLPRARRSPRSPANVSHQLLHSLDLFQFSVQTRLSGEHKAVSCL